LGNQGFVYNLVTMGVLSFFNRIWYVL